MGGQNDSLIISIDPFGTTHNTRRADRPGDDYQYLYTYPQKTGPLSPCKNIDKFKKLENKSSFHVQFTRLSMLVSFCFFFICHHLALAILWEKFVQNFPAV